MCWEVAKSCMGLKSIQIFEELIKNKSISDLESLSPAEIKQLIQTAKLANVIISEQFGGQGKSLKETLEILQYVARRAPSIGVILCMHYHVIVTISTLPDYFSFSEELLTDVAQNNRLVASAFAEGVPDLDIFTSTVQVKAIGDENFVEISGYKKPCTMSGIADYYAVSVVADHNQKGVAVIRADIPGISQKAFWPSELLKATDSNQVIFDRVKISKDWMLIGDEESVLGLLSVGLAMFNLMISVAYTGVAVGLSEKLPDSVLANKSVYIDIYGKLLQSYYSAIGLSDRLSDMALLETTLNQILILRYQNQATLKQIVSLVSENVGSFKFLSDPEIAKLSAICSLIAFHPLNRKSYENS